MLPEAHTIQIARDFSETPYGRYRADGEESGQTFREDELIPALQKYGQVRLLLDGVEGLPSSFWEEVMGGLVRAGWTLKDLQKRIQIETSERELQVYVRLGWRYAEEAAENSLH